MTPSSAYIVWGIEVNGLDMTEWLPSNLLDRNVGEIHFEKPTVSKMAKI